ncbi:MAG: ABC transporter ATP-binding protein [Lachnospiraceae bacterium]|nr:ABC transporter ATP-binding protein [Lachnospiraceae bacterium]
MDNLSVKELNVCIGSRQIIKDVSFDLHSGQILLVSGKNGCGKTTLIKTLAGIIPPSSGLISVCGVQYPGADIYRHVGYAPWRFGVYNSTTVYEYLYFYSSCAGRRGLMAKRNIESLMERFELTKNRDRQISHMSAGNLQRINIVRSVLTDPEVLLFDEPLNCMDPKGRDIFAEFIKERASQGGCILMSSHNLSQTGQFCTDVCFLEGGSIRLMESIENVRMRDMENSRVRIVLADADRMGEAEELLLASAQVKNISYSGDELMVGLDGAGSVDILRRAFMERGIATVVFASETRTLEQVFEGYYQ